MRRWFTLGLAVAALLIAGFVYLRHIRPIDDLALADARPIPASAVPDPQFRDAGKPWWKLEFTGDVAWAREVQRQELNSYPIVVRCDRRDSELFAIGPYLGDRLVTDWRLAARAQMPSGQVRYTVYLPQRSRYTSKRDVNAKVGAYDLGLERLTLCIRFAGGSMIGAYGETNEVRVTLGGR